MIKTIDGVITLEAPTLIESLNQVQKIIFNNNNQGSRSKFPGLVIAHLTQPYPSAWEFEREMGLSQYTENWDSEDKEIYSHFYKFDHLHTADHFLVHSNSDIQKVLSIHLSGLAPPTKSASLSYQVHKLKIPVQISTVLTTEPARLDNMALALLNYYAPLYCLYCAKANDQIPASLETMPMSKLRTMKYKKIYMDRITRTLEKRTKDEPKNQIDFTTPDIRQVRDVAFYDKDYGEMPGGPKMP